MQEVQTTLPNGSIVGERYQTEELLGKGGFGAVYLVRDLRVRQNVFALKEIIDPNQRERRHFTFEVDILKRTDHPSLPRVYRSFDDPVQGRAYMLMDYVEGSNLEKLRRQRPEQRLSLAEVFALLAPIVEALTYLHTQNPPIVHRDIKPSNIIAPDSGERTVLVDFGIAKEFDQEGTTTAVRHATPGYGAPEQYGTGTDTRTDIYGLGATLYTLLTGSPPIDAFYRMTQQMSKQNDPLQTVRQQVPTIPEYISSAIAQAMALEKNERFATVEDFWQALQPGEYVQSAAAPLSRAKLASPSVEVRPISRPTSEYVPASSRPRRGRWIIMAFLLLLALGIGFAAALFSLPKLHGQPANAPTARAFASATHAPKATLTPSPTPSPTTRPTPTATPQPTTAPTSQPTAAPVNNLPTLATMYSGTIYNNHGPINSTMSLRGVSQNGEHIQGMFLVAPPLNGNGPFNGTVKAASSNNANASIQFVVHSSDPGAGAPLFFSGQIQQNGDMSGQYCSLDVTGYCNPGAGGYGTWSIYPNNSGS